MVIRSKEIQEEENWEHFSIYTSPYRDFSLHLETLKQLTSKKEPGPLLYKTVKFIFSYRKQVN